MYTKITSTDARKTSKGEGLEKQELPYMYIDTGIVPAVITPRNFKYNPICNKDTEKGRGPPLFTCVPDIAQVRLHMEGMVGFPGWLLHT